jgi:mitofusin
LYGIADLQHERSIVISDDVVQVEGYTVKVKGIRDVLTRDHMKVAFFGR